MSAEQIARALGNARRVGNGWMARCPLASEHQNGDANPSLSISERAGTILVHCQSRHPTEQDRVIAALRALGLWQDANASETLNGKRIVATYDYRDESGALLFQVVRYQPKKFLQRRPDGKGGWEWNLNSIKRVLYRNPELLAANRNETVWIVEGEKDANALAGLGLVATTNPGGAGKWRTEYNEPLRGRRVAILPDNDQTGEDHARVIAVALASAAASVRIVQLPSLPPKGDASDWISTRRIEGKDDPAIIAELHALLEATEPTPRPASPGTAGGFCTVAEYLALTKERDAKRHLWQGVLREGEVSLLVGRAMAGKSTFACALTRALRSGSMLLGRPCVTASVGYMALERNGHAVARLFEKWGIADNVNFLDELPPMQNDQLAQYIESEIRRLNLGIVIVDHLQNLVRVRDVKDYSMVSLALEPFHKVAKHTGCQVMLLHHQGKTKREDGIDVMGSEAFRAAADALLEVTRSDDRHFIRGEIRGEPDLPRTMIAINLESGDVAGVEARDAEIAAVKAEIIRFLETRSEAVTAEMILREGVPKKARTVTDALKASIEDGLLVRIGAGKKGDPYLYQKAGFYSQTPMGKAGRESEKVGEPQHTVGVIPFPPSQEKNHTATTDREVF